MVSLTERLGAHGHELSDPTKKQHATVSPVIELHTGPEWYPNQPAGVVSRFTSIYAEHRGRRTDAYGVGETDDGQIIRGWVYYQHREAKK